MVHHRQVSHHISFASYTPRARTALSHQFPLDTMRCAAECSWCAICLLAPPCYHTVIKWIGDALQGHDWVRLEAIMEWVWEIHFEAGIESVWRCTWRPWSCELGGRNRARLEIHSDAVIEQVWRCTWRPWCTKFRDGLGGHDHTRLAMHLQAGIVQVCRWSWRSWLYKLGGSNRARVEIHSEAVIERVWTYT